MGGSGDDRRGPRPDRGDREGGYRRRFDGKEGGPSGEFKPELYAPVPSCLRTTADQGTAVVALAAAVALLPPPRSKCVLLLFLLLCLGALFLLFFFFLLNKEGLVFVQGFLFLGGTTKNLWIVLRVSGCRDWSCCCCWHCTGGKEIFKHNPLCRSYCIREIQNGVLFDLIIFRQPFFFKFYLWQTNPPTRFNTSSASFKIHIIKIEVKLTDSTAAAEIVVVAVVVITVVVIAMLVSK